MARTVSKTDASTAQSTPPKTGTDAQVQRMNNMIKSLIGSGLPRGVIGSMYRDAMKTQGSASGRSVSDKDVETVKKAQGKASGGRVKKMYGGKAKKK